ncbi:AAA family ATPase [Jatrophihabitans lederbergiae]|uniref:AAA family ATPase n=1 Tax=Jatrophihabitans lederbergiae TaxID=3075547 RepID=A0ABU2JAF5_9ACTN|nr:AAA family ATPase [Jatrophihabitans sp. DSM 44399]MDT0261454.1 AAA family ATPase [Jatrophihabitans sp. DSM 44399]
MQPTEPPAPLSLLGNNDDGRRFLTGALGEFRGVTSAPPDRPPFLVTKEHRRFAEFADTVRRHRYIGVCWGPPGVGKTLSARQYAGTDAWEQWQRVLAAGRNTDPGPVPAAVLSARTALWTPTVTATAKEIDQALPRACQQISWAVDYHEHGHVDPLMHPESSASGLTELLIVDEADRLKTVGLEQVRDYYDRHHMGVVLIGMPGVERRLARYPQLYSRIGFAHEYRPLSPDELTAVLTRRWHTDGLATTDDFTQAVAIATIARITGGNFRLVDRLLAQIQRIRRINNLETVTAEVVEAAREALLIGT